MIPGKPPWAMLAKNLQSAKEVLAAVDPAELAQWDQLITVLRNEVEKQIDLGNADQRFGLMIGAGLATALIGEKLGGSTVDEKGAYALVIVASLQWMTSEERDQIPGL